MQNYFENLEQAATEINAANTAKGFWQPGVKRAISETVALAISELYEGLEAARTGNEKANITKFCESLDFYHENNKQAIENPVNVGEYVVSTDYFILLFKGNIKDTLPDELADFIIRCLDLAKGHEMNIIEIQQLFNMFYETWKGEDDAAINGYFANLTLAELIIDATDEMAGVVRNPYAKYAAFAAAMCRVLMYCEANQINLNWHIHYKLLYNSTRGLKHGKSF